MIVFEVVSALNKKIRLTDVQLFHLLIHHNELSNQTERMKETLTDPDLVLYDRKEGNFHYYKHYIDTPVTEKYMLVIAKHLNKGGFIITAFFTRKVKKVEIVWSKKQ